MLRTKQSSLRWWIVMAVPLLLPLLLSPASSAAPRARVSAELQLVAPGRCGSVLLLGSSWLGGAGVDVYSNGPDEGTSGDCKPSSLNSVNGIPTGEKWQCVELINRLYLTKGWISSTWHGDAGTPFWNNTPGNLLKQPNGSVSYLGTGDVVIINEIHDGSTSGHVLIVNDSSNVSNGTVDLVSQNSGNPSNATPQKTGTIAGGIVTVLGSGGGYTYQTVGVVHAPTPPTVGVDSSGNQYVFWEGLGGGMWEKSYSGGRWNVPVLVLPAGTMGSPPAVAVHVNGEQDVFWKGRDGNLWETWYTGGHWNGPYNLGDGSLG